MDKSIKLDFDFKKVMEKSKENPVFYVQYAHARCNSIFRSSKVKEEELILKNPKRLENGFEIELIKFIALWPRTLELAAKNHEPHRICYYLIELSSIFHSLWNKGKDYNIKYNYFFWIIWIYHIYFNSRFNKMIN